MKRLTPTTRTHRRVTIHWRDLIIAISAMGQFVAAIIPHGGVH